MQLTRFPIREQTIRDLLEEARRLLREQCRAVFPRFPFAVPQNRARALPEDFLASGVFSENGWRTFVENEFWWKLTAGHLELRELFPSFPELLAQGECVLFGIPLTAVLGRGSDSAVYRTEHGCALKVVPPEKREKLRREYGLLKGISNRHVVRMEEWFQSSGGAAALMEPVSVRLSAFEDYRDGLRAIHESGFLHGDIRRFNLGRTRQGCGVLFDLGNAVPWTGKSAEAEWRNLALLFEAGNSSGKTIRMKAEKLCG